MKFKTVLAPPHSQWLGGGERTDCIYAKVYEACKPNYPDPSDAERALQVEVHQGCTPGGLRDKAKPGSDIDTHGWDSIVGAGRILCKEPHVQH